MRRFHSGGVSRYRADAVSLALLPAPFLSPRSLRGEQEG
jgi:hypothetical protein